MRYLSPDPLERVRVRVRVRRAFTAVHVNRFTMAMARFTAAMGINFERAQKGAPPGNMASFVLGRLLNMCRTLRALAVVFARRKFTGPKKE